MSTTNKELCHEETPEERLEAFLRAAYLASIVEQDSERGKRKTNPLHKGVADYILASAARAGRRLDLVGLDSEYKSRSVGKPVVHGRFISEKQGDVAFRESNPSATVCVEVKFPTKTYGKNEINHFEILLGQVANLKLKKGGDSQRFFFVQVRRSEFPIEDAKGNVSGATEKVTDDRLSKYREVMSLAGPKEEVVRPDHLLYVLVEVKHGPTGLVPELCYREDKASLQREAKRELEAFEAFLDYMRAIENVEASRQELNIKIMHKRVNLDALTALFPTTQTSKSRLHRAAVTERASELVDKIVGYISTTGPLAKLGNEIRALRKKLIESASNPSLAAADIEAFFATCFDQAVLVLNSRLNDARLNWQAKRWPALQFRIANHQSSFYERTRLTADPLSQASEEFLRQYGPSAEVHKTLFPASTTLPSSSPTPALPSPQGNP